MRTQVTVIPTYGGWHLFIETLDDQGNEVLSRAFKFKRLIEAINMASALQLHIDNIDELPVHQYSMVS